MKIPKKLRIKWTKKQKRLIQETIEHYETEIRKNIKNRNLWNVQYCPFCKSYHKGLLDCSFYCPNEVIIKLITGKTDGDYACAKTLELSPKFTKCKGNELCTEHCIKLRIRFWKDALTISKEEFIKKWFRR